MKFESATSRSPKKPPCTLIIKEGEIPVKKKLAKKVGGQPSLHSNRLVYAGQASNYTALTAQGIPLPALHFPGGPCVDTVYRIHTATVDRPHAKDLAGNLRKVDETGDVTVPD